MEIKWTYQKYEYENFYLYQEKTNTKQTTQIFAINSFYTYYIKEIPLLEGNDDFFRLIPHLLSSPYLETQIKKYVLSTIQEETYNCEQSKELFKIFDSNLESIHSFMHVATIRLTFVRRRLTKIYIHLQSHLKNNDERKKFMFRLFTPIYEHYLPFIKRESSFKTSEHYTPDTFIEELFKNIHKKDNHVSDNVWDFNMFSTSINNHEILCFEQLSEIIHKCCSLMMIPRDIATYKQLHLAFLLSNSSYVSLLDQCQIYTKDSIQYKLFDKLTKPIYNPYNDLIPRRGVYIETEDQLNEYKTSSLVKKLMDLPPSLTYEDQDINTTTNESIEETKYHLNHDIPKDLFNGEYKLAKFRDFNHLIALSLNKLFEEQLIIKKCKTTECNRYFPSKDLKSQYCKYHQRKDNYVRMHYANTIKGHPEYGEIYHRFRNALYQRVHRISNDVQKEEFKNKISSWNEDVKKFNNEIQNDLTIILLEDTYIDELNSLCRKYGLKEVRFYKTRKP